MRMPTNNGKAPALAVDYHMGIHTALYNYFTTFSASRGLAPAGADFYELLDDYFGDVARDILLGVPDDDRLVHYLLPCFQRYSAGAASISRLLNYTNRQYVKRAIDVRALFYCSPPLHVVLGAQSTDAGHFSVRDPLWVLGGMKAFASPSLVSRPFQIAICTPMHPALRMAEHRTHTAVMLSTPLKPSACIFAA